MAYGRHCASVEIDLRQAIVLQERVLNLEERGDRNLRTSIQHGELRPHEKVKEAEEVVRGTEELESHEESDRRQVV
jgi:hypothetical protein